MKNQLKNPNFYIIIAVDLTLFILAHAFAYTLRFDLMMNPREWSNFWEFLPFVIGIKFCRFIAFGVYRGMWRYVSINDLFTLLKAVTLAFLIIITLVLVMYRFQGFSRGVFIIDWILTFVLIGGSRVLIRQAFHSHILKDRFGKGAVYKPESVKKRSL